MKKDGVITKKPVGRPSKYKPEYCQALIEHMEKGYSFETFGPAVGAGTRAAYRWLEKSKEFRRAKEEAEARCRLFWERIGIAGVMGKIDGFNASAWIFNMKNRFAWRDRTENTHEHFVSPHQYLVNLMKQKERVIDIGETKEDQ